MVYNSFMFYAPYLAKVNANPATIFCRFEAAQNLVEEMDANHVDELEEMVPQTV